MTLEQSQVLGWNGGQEKLECPNEPKRITNRDLESSLHLESEIGVFATGIGSVTLGNSPSKESLNKWSRLFGFSSFIE
jgi:hypothetical protein